MTFITAADSHTFIKVENLIGSIHRFLPLCHTLVFDLGLTRDQQLRVSSWRGVTLLSAPFPVKPAPPSIPLARLVLVREAFRYLRLLALSATSPAFAFDGHDTEDLEIDDASNFNFSRPQRVRQNSPYFSALSGVCSTRLMCGQPNPRVLFVESGYDPRPRPRPRLPLCLVCSLFIFWRLRCVVV